jgi:DNA repair protein RadA/Sms
MAKGSTKYVCQQCNYQSLSYLGKCPNCDSWGSLVETVVSEDKGKGKRQKEKTSSSKPQKLSEASKKPLQRLRSGISELDRVLGGGIVPGSVVLLAGDPGIGKSTLLLQLASRIKSLYISGEESVEQVKLRSDRLGIKGKELFIIPETDVDSAAETISEDKYKLVVADSIQTLMTEDLNSAAGSVGQVRESAYRLHRLAKESGSAVFLVGHVTKEGSVAGPKVLEHLVDTVLFLEGEQHHAFRILSASKNRFGPVDEIGVFEMGEKGMEEVKNPSKQFLSGRIQAPGSVVVPILEGSRSVLTEVQALTNPTNFGLPTRRSSGIDPNRLQLLVATLIKRAGVQLQNQDVFINIAGGLRVAEPAADLAICLAIASSAYDKVIPRDTLAVGEVGLLGEIREVPYINKRLAEARRLGFKKYITPQNVRTLREAVQKSFSK